MSDAHYLPDLMHLLNAQSNFCIAQDELKVTAHAHLMHLIEEFTKKWDLKENIK